MCGIAGQFYYSANGSVSESRLLRLCEELSHRGPDDSGIWLSENRRIGLAHRRLSIIDLSQGGHQPMLSADASLVLSYNGELYNYQSRRKELSDDGYHCKTSSDTEVVLAMFQKYGLSFFEKLRGMFALAIWDVQREELLLARDPFGIKPLYYSDVGGSISFASELKTLIRVFEPPLALDPAGIGSYLVFGSVSEPNTLFRSIRQLPAGYFLKVSSRSGVSLENYFSLDSCFLESSVAAEQYDLGESLRGSVEQHLVADTKVSIFLSAGIDSSVLAAHAAEVVKGPLSTITLGFEEFRGGPNDETVLAEKTAGLIGSEHTTCWTSYDDFLGSLPSFFECMDQPSIDGLNSFLICKAARKMGCKVAISGLGADELFGGYPSFRRIPQITSVLSMLDSFPDFNAWTRKSMNSLSLGRLPPKISSLLEYGTSVERAYLLQRCVFLPWELETLLRGELGRVCHQEVLAGALTGGLDDLPLPNYWKVSLLELSRYMRNQLLRDTDCFSMAHGLEVRVPFVDVEVLRAVVARSLQGPILGKQELLRTAPLSLPQDLSSRPKTGFVVPVRHWLERAGYAPQQERGLRSWSKLVLSEYLARIAPAALEEVQLPASSISQTRELPR